MSILLSILSLYVIIGLTLSAIWYERFDAPWWGRLMTGLLWPFFIFLLP